MAIQQTQPDRLSLAFQALSDPTRRAILARLSVGEASVSELMAPFALSQPTISKHLKVLETAGLIVTGQDAQRRPRRLNPVALKDAADWIEPFRRIWERRFDNLDSHLATMPPEETLNMPASATAAPSDGFTIDHATYTIRFERDLAASPAQAFKAWTLPEHMAQWWDAAGDRLVTCEIDLRVGGAFTFISKGHPEMPFTGTYSEIAPPTRLVFNAMAAKGVVTLEPRGSGTHMTVEIICGSAEMLEQYGKMGVAVGTSQTLDNLVGYVSEAALAEG